MLTKRHRYLLGICADYSTAAYSKDIDGLFLENAETDCQAFITTRGNDIVFTGQGTTSLKDWSIDFQLWRKRVPYLNNTLVHAGFIKAYESIRSGVHKEMSRLLSQADRKFDRILCTGHSLFGAIATIAALDFALKYELPIHCITFGSPRVGSSGFVKCFNDNVDVSYRCVKNKDPITFTPLPIRFKHVRGSLHLGETLSNKTYLYNCIGCKVSDHSMNNYFDYIINL